MTHVRCIVHASEKKDQQSKNKDGLDAYELCFRVGGGGEK